MKGVARSAVRRGGPCGPPLLMRSLPQLCLCGFLRNPLHGFQSEPFRRPVRHRTRPTTARLRIRSATPAKGKGPEGLFPRVAMRATFAPSGLAAFFAAFAADQSNHACRSSCVGTALSVIRMNARMRQMPLSARMRKCGFSIVREDALGMPHGYFVFTAFLADQLE